MRAALLAAALLAAASASAPGCVPMSGIPLERPAAPEPQMTKYPATTKGDVAPPRPPTTTKYPATTKGDVAPPRPATTKYPMTAEPPRDPATTKYPPTMRTAAPPTDAPETTAPPATTARAPPPRPQNPAPAPDGDTTPRKHHWTDHPVYRAQPDILPPILTWFTTRNSEEQEMAVYSLGRYTQRASRYNLISSDKRETPAAKEFWDYDLLHIGTWGAENRPNFLEFETTRESKMCIIMGIDDNRYDHNRDNTMKPPPGFKPVGMTQWDEDSPKPENHKYAPYTGNAIGWGFMACKLIRAGEHKMGSVDILGNEYKVSNYNLIFAEADGTPAELTPMPNGWTGPEIKQHEPCPKELHELWVVENHDPNDPDTAGKMWPTWHPQKDPLYGCGYGHEHGTPGILAGYTERLSYTAWKNNLQDESHEGFKSYVVPVRGNEHFLVVNLHSDTKDMERIDKDLHTMVVAVTEKRGGKLMFEMSCKSRSGGSACDYKERPKEGTPFYTVGSPAGKKMVDDIYKEKYWDRVNIRKRVNCQNPANLNPDLRYEGDGTSIRRGVYEGWHMKALGEICMNATTKPRAAGPLVDIKNSQTACIDRDCTRTLVLGQEPNQYRDYFVPNGGTNREIVFRGISIGPQYCDHELPEPDADGYYRFYTNPTCMELCDGPGPNCILQKIHSSFKGVHLNDAYEVSDAHGHHVYQVSRPDGVDNFETRVKGLRGIIPVEDSLAHNLMEA